jgi:hypothetical protein
MSASCKPEKDRTKWDPTPVINSIEIINSEYDPINRIDYTSLGEWWARIKINGKDFSDEFGSVENIYFLKNNNETMNMGCSIYTVTYNEIVCIVSDFSGPQWRAGTYFIRVKREYSDWSNTVEVEVY